MRCRGCPRALRSALFVTWLLSSCESHWLLGGDHLQAWFGLLMLLCSACR